MTLSVLGLGLISPAGASARDHVFFLRAGAPPPPPSPFLGPDGRRIDARHCPWMKPRNADADRLLALARSAAAEALAALPRGAAAAVPLFLVTPAPRPGLPEEALAGLARGLAPAAQRFTGAAGAFAALAQIAERFASRTIGAALLVGVDSFAGLDALAERQERPPSPWLLAPPPPSEGAGAVLLASPEQASRFGLAALGEIVASRCVPGRATDEDDEPVDAAAMTALFQGLPASRPVQAVFGQGRVDALRCREWEWTAARSADRLASSYFGPCLEAEVGALGAAAGAMNLAYAFASFRHGAAPPDAASCFVAWAISRDGTRGIALGCAPPPSADTTADGAPVLRPLAVEVTARRVERDLFVPPPDPPEDEPDDEAWRDEDGAGAEAAAPVAAANDVDPLLPALPREIAAAAPVRLDPERAIELALPDFYASVVAHCGELTAALARDRLEAPRAWLPSTEARLLCQVDAIVAAGPRAVIELAAFWERSIDDPWRSSAAALALAAFAGDDALAAIHRAVHLLPHDAEDHAITVAEALAHADHPGLEDLTRALSASAHPIARAIGVTLLSSRGEIPLAALGVALDDDHDAVVRAAIWACERLPVAQRARFTEQLRERCRAGAPAVAWSAARVLAIGGEPDLHRDDALCGRLGPRAAELFVLAGGPADWPRLEALLGRHRPTRASLSAVGRFGCPASSDWLIRHLDEELADDAAQALRTLLGPLVPAARASDAGAWREALAAQPLDPRARYRRGRLFSPAVVADECASGELSRLALEQRLDELRARLRLPELVDVSGPHARAEANLTTFLALARSRG
ncbi:hypothetical protein [Sorangium sp. So ce1151]|uniref:hypothetical protein n=1 Tax=Sorangium sp. So ce1151 TaxID=3133332 RepID=UPI003F5FEA4A